MYTVYRTINKINNKFYIGVHKTDNPNDSYLGSGKIILLAIKKYGKENFYKEIVFITDNKKLAYNVEKSLTIDVKSDNIYNIKRGGTGGFTREACIKGANAVNSKLTPQEKTNRIHKMNQIMTPQQRSERTRRGNLTRSQRKKQIKNSEI